MLKISCGCVSAGGADRKGISLCERAGRSGIGIRSRRMKETLLERARRSLTRHTKLQEADGRARNGRGEGEIEMRRKEELEAL